MLANISVCCMFTVLLCVVQSSISLPMHTLQVLNGSESAGIPEHINQNYHNISRSDLLKIFEHVEVRKPKSQILESYQKSLAFFLDSKTKYNVEEIPPDAFNWELTKNYIIKLLVNQYAARRDGPIYDYIFYQLQFDRKFLK